MLTHQILITKTNGQFAVVAILMPPVTLHKVGHVCLLEVLSDLGLQDTVLSWLYSRVTGHSLLVNLSSLICDLGVLQGPVLEILYSLSFDCI